MNAKHTHEDLKSAILERISEGDIKPYSQYYWYGIEAAVWILWGVAILIGALAVSVLLYAVLQISYELHDIIYVSTSEYILKLLPFVWFFVLALMTVVAYYNLRHTKHGYRYSLSVVILSNVGASVIAGFILYFVGVGYYVDTYVGQMAPLYQSQAARGLHDWQDPVHGRLLGQLVDEMADEDMIMFRDVEGVEWQLDTAELRAMDLELLHSGNTVRIIGIVATNTPSMIHGCGAFPWLLDKPPALEDLRKQRQGFEKRLQATFDEVKENVLRDGEAEDNVMDDHLCRPIFLRIQH